MKCIECDGTGWIEKVAEQTAEKCWRCGGEGKLMSANKYDIHYVRNPLGSGMAWTEEPTVAVCGTDIVVETMVSKVEAPVTCSGCLIWIQTNAA